MEPGSPTASDAKYGLRSIQELWSQRWAIGDGQPFASPGTFRGDDPPNGKNKANAPWGWQTGFFCAPADWVNTHSGTSLDNGYVGASFTPGPNDGDVCLPVLGDGCDLTFEQLTGTGSTTCSQSGTGPVAPAGYQVGNSPHYFDASTTATYTGRISICSQYEENNYTNERGVRLLHNVSGSWYDVTTSVDPEINRACALDVSLSPFLIAELIPADDQDSDGCTNQAELQDDQTTGGLRDPLNSYDYFNPSHDGQNRVDDILLVVKAYFKDTGNPAYREDTDRTLIGPNLWNLGPPDGLQRVDDILNALHQYFHDCS